MAVQGDENVRERDSVSRRRTGTKLRLWTARIPVSPKPSTSSKQKRVRSSTQKKCGKEKAKEVQEFDEFQVKVKVVKSEARMTQGKKAWSKWVEARKDPNKPWYESSGLSRRESRTQSKSRTNCTKRCGRSNGYFGPHPHQRSLQRVLLANASFADLKAWRNRDTISFYVVTPKDLRRKRKIWNLVKKSLRYS